MQPRQIRNVEPIRNPFRTPLAKRALVFLNTDPARCVGVQGDIYLIHFRDSFGHARHYLGWAKTGKLPERLLRHLNGRGANLLRHVNGADIAWRVAAVWRNVDRNWERQLKKWGGKCRFCPCCQGMVTAEELFS